MTIDVFCLIYDEKSEKSWMNLGKLGFNALGVVGTNAHLWDTFLSLRINQIAWTERILLRKLDYCSYTLVPPTYVNKDLQFYGKQKIYYKKMSIGNHS